jgi:hypothetical protein
MSAGLRQQLSIVVIETEIVGTVQVLLGFPYFAQFVETTANLASPINIGTRRCLEFSYEFLNINFNRKITDIVGVIVVRQQQFARIAVVVDIVDIVDQIVVTQSTVHSQSLMQPSAPL